MQLHWKHKFIIIWIGQSVSLLTSSVLQMAIIWYITQRTGSAMMLTFATLAGFVPQALLGLFTGVFVDRYNRKTIIMLSDSFIAVTSLVLAAIMFTLGELPIWVIMVILILRSIGTALQEPAVNALTPMIVPAEHLTQYAGFAQAFDAISMLISPGLAAILYAAWGMGVVSLLDVAGAALAVCLLLPIAIAKQKVSASANEQVHIIQETKNGLAILRKYGAMSLVITGAIYTMIFFPIGSLYPHISMVYFGASTDQAAIVETVFSAGALLGGLILAKCGDKISKFHALYGAMICYGAGVFFAGALPANGLYVFIGLSLAIGVTIPFYHGITAAVYQCRVPEQYLGRAFSVAMSVRRLAMPFGALISGVFADSVGVNVLFMILGVASIILGCSVRCVPSIKTCCNCMPISQDDDPCFLCEL